jgi:hypothetical protein
MRSAFRSPGVPSAGEAGTASLVGGPSNRPMRAGSAENSFLVNAGPRTHDRTKVFRECGGSIYPLNGGQTTRPKAACPLACGLRYRSRRMALFQMTKMALAAAGGVRRRYRAVRVNLLRTERAPCGPQGTWS